MDHIKKYMEDLNAVIAALDLESVRKAREACEVARDQGKQIFACGNGGSAATASHFTNDLGKGASYGRESRFKVISLTDNIPWMTALANDIDYEAIFAEQLRNFVGEGDVLIAISGSGNSQNVLNAVEVAREKGMTTVALTGFGGGKLAGMVDVPIVVDSHHMGRVEDLHMIIVHLICYYFMEG
ncbi:MAG: SIS domain-containing protein [Gemmatimonadetes bacterium]|jgi:D-sedoheptulose 7-phosphate isomerase|nr:SIS domain-containing protein [Gemmatimonadota bacterium]